MKKGKIFIISGPSGSGKTTLHKKLLDGNKSLVKSISVTTRSQRRGEKHGRDYYFLSKKMFLHKKKAGHFLESEKVFDNYYATPKKQVQDLLKRGKHVLLCIDVKGAKTVARKFPKAVKIFINVPSRKVLKNRLKVRGSESSKSLNLRLEIARREIKEAKRYDYVVVNDNLSIAFRKLKAIVSSEVSRNL